MNSFIYEISIVIFYTVELNTDFANIPKKIEYLRSQYSIQLYKYNNTDFVNERIIIHLRSPYTLTTVMLSQANQYMACI